MDLPKVSIITVTYNIVETIEQTIQSVLDQTYDNIEYIIIDGISTDGTWETICKYKELVDCIIHEPDKGLYDAMNKGIQLASGDVIGIINGDDWYEKDTVKKAVEFMQNSGADMVYGDMNIIDSEGNEIKVGKREIKNLWVDMVPHPTVFVKKNIYKIYGMFNLKYNIVADYEMILRFYVHGVKIEYIDDTLANFRKGGLTTRKRLECAKQVKDVSMTYIEQCYEKGKYIKLINRKYTNTLLNIIYEKEDSLFKDLLKEKIGNQSLCVYGAGRWGHRIIEKLNRCKIDISFIVDCNKDITGKSIGNVKIYLPEKLKNWEGYIFVATIDYDDVCNTLEQMKNKKLYVLDLAKIV